MGKPRKKSSDKKYQSQDQEHVDRYIEQGVSNQEVENIQQQQQPQHQEQQNLDDQDLIQENYDQQNAQHYQQKLANRGVCYLSRIPPYMKPNYIRKLLSSYNIERIYLLPQSDWARKNRIKRGGNKKICFREGWVQFNDKRMAKLAALTLNGQKMVHKKGNFYSQDLWNLKYLPKFKWHNLTQRLAHEQRLKKERLKVELQQERKIDQFYSSNVAKSQTINGIISNKINKGKQAKNSFKRSYEQYGLAPEIKDE